METPRVGTKFRAQVVFIAGATTTGTITDTTPVDVVVRHPSSTEDVLQYPTSTEVVKSTTGTYYVDVLPDDDGEWIIGFGSTGTVCAYNEVSVRVLPRRT